MSVYREPGDIKIAISRSLLERVDALLHVVAAMPACGELRWPQLRAAREELRVELEVARRVREYRA